MVTNDQSIIVLFVKFLRDVHNHCIMNSCIHLVHTVKLVLSNHSKKDKTKILKTNGSLIKVKSIAECSLGAFCNTFDLH